MLFARAAWLKVRLTKPAVSVMNQCEGVFGPQPACLLTRNNQSCPFCGALPWVAKLLSICGSVIEQWAARVSSKGCSNIEQWADEGVARASEHCAPDRVLARRDDVTTKILGISGSLRAGSYNTALLRAAQTAGGEGVHIEVATLHGIPLYDGDVEVRDGVPASVVALKEKIVACDGVLLVTPEYNNSIPGVFKNAIDWLSRPPSDIGRVFKNRAVALIGASPGGFGTILSQNAWLPVLRTLRVRYWAGGRLLVSRAGQAFDEKGGLKDDSVRDQLAKFVTGFAAYATAQLPEIPPEIAY